jgi:predicted transcriptional regulator
VSEPVKRSAIRRIESADAFPLVALQALRELRDDLEQRENDAILRARELGASLEDIAESMGITRQGVAYRIKAMNGNGDHDTPDVVDITDEAAEQAEPRLER